MPWLDECCSDERSDAQPARSSTENKKNKVVVLTGRFRWPKENCEITQRRAKVILLDRILANYGPEDLEAHRHRHSATGGNSTLVFIARQKEKKFLPVRAFERLASYPRACWPIGAWSYQESSRQAGLLQNPVCHTSLWSISIYIEEIPGIRGRQQPRASDTEPSVGWPADSLSLNVHRVRGESAILSQRANSRAGCQ